MPTRAMPGYTWKAKETNFTRIPSEYGVIHFHDDDLTDGSGVCYSLRLRPILNMRPKYTMPILGGGTGAPYQLNADLHLMDWMEEKGYQFDVETDEDLNFEGVSLLTPYRVVVTGSHPEYWSGQMLEAMEAYLTNGGWLR